jgi:hypothetical protein
MESFHYADGARPLTNPHHQINSKQISRSGNLNQLWPARSCVVAQDTKTAVAVRGPAYIDLGGAELLNWCGAITKNLGGAGGSFGHACLAIEWSTQDGEHWQ